MSTQNAIDEKSDCTTGGWLTSAIGILTRERKIIFPRAQFALRMPALKSAPSSSRLTQSSAIFPSFIRKITIASHASDFPFML
jgi:hypothetical protein